MIQTGQYMCIYLIIIDGLDCRVDNVLWYEFCTFCPKCAINYTKPHFDHWQMSSNFKMK